MLFKLGQNIGYKIDGVLAHKSQGDFGVKQKEAWDFVRRSIDERMPCYGWELEIPEFYVVYGYDAEGYYFSGPLCDVGKGPKAWQALGDTGIGVVEMYSVKPGQTADDARTVREALKFALEHAKGSAKWTWPKYKAGLTGFDNWIQALDTGSAIEHGMSYNTAVWCECRGFAVQFLKEAKERLDGKSGPLFDEAVEHYEVVHQNLQRLAELFPFTQNQDEIKDAPRCKSAVEYLDSAKKAEESGLSALEKIVGELESS